MVIKCMEHIYIEYYSNTTPVSATTGIKDNLPVIPFSTSTET